MNEKLNWPFYFSMPEMAATVPLLITSPHSGADYPADFLSASLLNAHNIRQSEDMFVDVLFGDAPRLGVPLLAARYPRAYVDLNRAPYELEQKLFADKLPDHIDTRSLRAAAGLGTVPRLVAENTPIYKSKLSFAEAEARIDEIYHPFHFRLRDTLDELHETHGYCVLIDAHSMPSQATLLSGQTDVDFILGNRYERACDPLLTELVHNFLVSRDWSVGLNKPYAGGYITQHYGAPNRGFHALQIEINRSIYMDEADYEKNACFAKVKQDMADLMSHLTACLPDLADILHAEATSRSAAE